MKPLIDYLHESRNKDDFYKVKTTTDKYYKALVTGHIFDHNYYLTPSKLIDNKWFKPSHKLTVDDEKKIQGMKYELDRLIGRPSKNPITGKPMGMYIDDFGVEITVHVTSQYKGEDSSESLASVIDTLLNLIIKDIPGERTDYRTILKDIRKELLKAYNDIPEPMTPAQCAAFRKSIDTDPLNLV